MTCRSSAILSDQAAVICAQDLINRAGLIRYLFGSAAHPLKGCFVRAPCTILPKRLSGFLPGNFRPTLRAHPPVAFKSNCCRQCPGAVEEAQNSSEITPDHLARYLLFVTLFVRDRKKLCSPWGTEAFLRWLLGDPGRAGPGHQSG